jgi:hypothetical protein
MKEYEQIDTHGRWVPCKADFSDFPGIHDVLIGIGVLREVPEPEKADP